MVEFQIEPQILELKTIVKHLAEEELQTTNYELSFYIRIKNIIQVQ
jgi:hypothetical protein